MLHASQFFLIWSCLSSDMVGKCTRLSRWNEPV